HTLERREVADVPAIRADEHLRAIRIREECSSRKHCQGRVACTGRVRSYLKWRGAAGQEKIASDSNAWRIKWLRRIVLARTCSRHSSVVFQCNVRFAEACHFCS